MSNTGATIQLITRTSEIMGGHCPPMLDFFGAAIEAPVNKEDDDQETAGQVSA